MKTLLRLDASSQRASSHSRRLADHYQDQWRRRFPKGQILTRDLVGDPLPHLDEATAAAFYPGGEPASDPAPTGVALSNRLIAELKLADCVLVSSPLYNFNMPSSLKAWIDHVVRLGHTFAFTENGPRGLVTNKRARFITARGGFAGSSPDYQAPSLHAVFSYLGFDDMVSIGLEGTQASDGHLEARLSGSREEIDRLFNDEMPG